MYFVVVKCVALWLVCLVFNIIIMVLVVVVYTLFSVMGGVRSSCHTSTGVDTVCAEAGRYYTFVVNAVAVRFHELQCQPSSRCAWSAFHKKTEIGIPKGRSGRYNLYCIPFMVQLRSNLARAVSSWTIMVLVTDDII